MITCRELAELLLDFVADELTPEHRQRIEQHLKICPPCVAFVETYRLTITLTRKLPCDSMPADVAERLRAVVAECSKQQHPGQGEYQC